MPQVDTAETWLARLEGLSPPVKHGILIFITLFIGLVHFHRHVSFSFLGGSSNTVCAAYAEGPRAEGFWIWGARLRCSA